MSQDQAVTATKLLMPAFEFTEEDLAANRAGRMTPKQQKGLQNSMSILGCFSVLPAVLALVLGVIFVRLPFTNVDFGYFVAYSGLLLMVLVFAAAVAGIWYIMRRYWLDLHQNQVASVCGSTYTVTVERHTSRRRYKLRYMVVGQTRFPIGEKGYEELEWLRENSKAVTGYCVYFAPRTKVILSIHPDTYPPQAI